MAEPSRPDRRNKPDPEELTEQDIEHQAEVEPDDPTTRREELELELMEEGRSEEGEEIGEHIE